MKQSSRFQTTRIRCVPFCLSAALGLALLTGCSSRHELVAVESGFPSPVIAPLPLRMGVYLSEDLRHFRHEESIPRHSNWTFELGEANVSLFQPLFAAMFEQVVPADTVPTGGNAVADLDGILEPRLERFEFDMPRGRDTRFAEVWLQYRVHLYSPDGRLVADWPVTGYGKSRASGSMPRGALKEATIRAMREAGASISIRFETQPAVADWLKDVDNGRAALGSVGEVSH